MEGPWGQGHSSRLDMNTNRKRRDFLAGHVLSASLLRWGSSGLSPHSLRLGLVYNERYTHGCYRVQVYPYCYKLIVF